MKNIRKRWKTGSGPISSGLFYPNGTYRSATLDRKNASLKFSEILQSSSEVRFADYGDDENGRLQCEAGVLRWGGGPWEGEGWIALEDHDTNLIWLLHFDDSEQFTQARFEGGIVEAIAYEYPLTTSLSIPVADPHLSSLVMDTDAS